ncbi:1-alkyl-2-acetylglycerophosphocholine esterase [Scedosporium apiospermum]|uniref:1-alkyl-2-acetylglycerophosphocholine esterase n=1 Tax=Pseudallescheria apiosperma TaxID=563466 RepID=A0A084FY35_PSEDA|nr:1-alkyl-2-acetylglycerophosphocholine esterase [Scedosporium apiospermum]KEZ39997.1 1-alkyl-2-acetylglycerophosphocholine esterase [Scedosporium apiospermum]
MLQRLGYTALLRAAGPLKPEIRLAQAVSLFEADLSPEQKRTFRSRRDNSLKSPPDIQDVMHLTAEIDRHRLGSGPCLGPRLTNMLQAIQQFAALGDIVIGGAQNIIASGVWTLSLVNFSSCLEKMSTLFMIVGRSAPRYESMALLYPRSRTLQSHLSEYFIVVVRLCHQMLKFTRKSVWGQLASFLSDSDMNGYQSELDRWANMIKEEVSLLTAQNIKEQGAHLKVLSKFSAAESHRQKLKAHVRVLNYCSTYDYQTTWKEIRKIGKSTLLEKAPEYQQWKAETDSQTLVCTGKLGTITIPEDNSDIGTFITTELGRRMECTGSTKLNIGDPMLILEIRDALLRGAQGMFLWVSLQIESLCAEETDEAVRQALANLPKDLPTTFYRILQKWEGQGKKYQTRIFELVLAARQPLTTEALREALSVVPGDAVWRPASLLNDVYSVLSYCGSLIIVDEEELTVRLMHHSVKQFLLGEFKDASGVGFTMERVNKTMASVIVTYLSYGVFDTQVSTMVVPQVMMGMGGAPSRIIHSTTETSGFVRDLALKLLKSRGQANYNMAVEEGHDEIVRLLVEKGADVETTGSSGQTLLATAVAGGREAIVRLLLATGRIDVNSRNHSGQTALWIAAERGHTTIVGLLLNASFGARLVDSGDGYHHTTASSFAVDKRLEALNVLVPRGPILVNFRDSCGRTPLWLAASRGYTAIAELLLNRIDVDVDSADEYYCMTPLSVAALNGHKAIVELLLDTFGVDVNSRNYFQQTPLSVAAEMGHTDIVELLLQMLHAVDFSSSGESRMTPLSYAAKNGREAIVKLLLDTGRVNINWRDSSTWIPLYWAAKNGHKSIFKLLLASDQTEFDLTPEDGVYGQTILVWAVRAGYWDAVEELLATGTLDLAWGGSGNKQTLLPWAAENGDEYIVKVVLGTGRADVNATTFLGWTPLLCAVIKGHEAVVRLLLTKKTVDINSKDRFGRTPLWWAASGGHEGIVKLLLSSDRDVDVNSPNPDRQSPLWWAAAKGYEGIVKLLLRTGRVDVDARDSLLQRTPLLCAAVKGYASIAKLLLDTGKVDVNARDAENRTPLLWAAENGHFSMIKLLLSVPEININVTDTYNRTPLWWAAENGYEYVVRLLMALGKDRQVDVGTMDSIFRQTPASRAAKKGHDTIVYLLLRRNY